MNPTNTNTNTTISGLINSEYAHIRAGGTPKRRLSYTSTPTNGSTTITNSSSSGSSVTPFIKRKCLQESNAILTNTWKNNSPLYNNTNTIATTTTAATATTTATHSPYELTSNITTNVSFSPRHLNESFETLQINNENKMPTNNNTVISSGQNTICVENRRILGNKNTNLIMNSRTTKRTMLNKYKSAPIQMLDFNNENIHDHHSPLGDISNQQFQTTTTTTTTTTSTTSQQSTTNDELENLWLENKCVTTTTTVTHHLNENFIKESLEIEEQSCQSLIGDRSKTHLLPYKRSNKHTDLFCITPDTLIDLLDGKYENQVEKYIIIDSRYPYEYDGGHIQNAKNIYTKERLLEELFVPVTDNDKSTDSNQTLTASGASDSNTAINAAYTSNTKRVIIIFHCEFSSERGPTLLRFLRNQDRTLNEHMYPKLFYPELYLLEGGYKNFYEKFRNYCQPQYYKPMLHAEHVKDLKHFRAKSKSWEIQKQQHLANSTYKNMKTSASSMTIKHIQKQSSNVRVIDENGH